MLILSDYYNSYYEYANTLDIEWQKMNINELCRLYCRRIDDNLECDRYLAAIVCRYWNSINTLYRNSSTMGVDEFECYNWLMDTLKYELDSRPWDNENNSLYNDPTGPDKAIHKNMNALRVNYVVASNRDKRIVNANANKISIDINSSDEEHTSPVVELKFTDSHDWVQSDYTDALVKYFFSIYDYMPAFIIDIILNEGDDVFDCGKFSPKKLKKVLSHLDTDYCTYFADRYELSLPSVLKLSNLYATSSADLLYDNIVIAIDKLKCKLKIDEWVEI